MSTYPWKELLKLWQQDELTQEQLLGQLLLHGREMAATLQVCQRDLSTSQRDLAESQRVQVHLSEQINQLLQRVADLEALNP